MLPRSIILLSLAISGPVAAQELSKVSLSPVVRVTLQLDSGSTARFNAHGFDLRVTQAGAPASAEIELVKVAGTSTGDLVSMSANAARAPSGMIEVLDSLGRSAVTLRLSDISIVSDHLSLSATRASLEQQRISQQEALSALTADQQEAQRQLATLEELGKTRVATRMDVARARDRASDLQRRIDLLKQRQALLASQIANQAGGPLDETIVLHFGRLQIESAEPGGRAAIDFARRPTPKRD